MKIKTIDYRFRNYTSGHGVDLGDRLDPDEEDEVAVDHDLDLPLQKLLTIALLLSSELLVLRELDRMRMRWLSLPFTVNQGPMSLLWMIWTVHPPI